MFHFMVYSFAAGGLSLDSLDLTEPPRKDQMSLSRDSGLTLSDCQLFIPESPIGSEDSAVNASSSSRDFDKSLSKETDKTTSNKSAYSNGRIYFNWEDRVNGCLHLQNGLDLSFREDKNGIVGYPNPNFQRQDWLRAQLKRMPRKFDEEQQQKDIYGRKYLNGRQDAIKENVENCKEVLYRYVLRLF